nr:MAG TPA: hypothetical protein [Caudoviricetes sp.]
MPIRCATFDCDMPLSDIIPRSLSVLITFSPP